ncbi:MAG: Dabb family protein [Proteobacteria bacterium]|nr:Dabb family protein [Pseudomonadota bacterium]
MIRHVVLCKFRTSVSEEKRENAINTLNTLGQSIPEVGEWSMGKQALPSKTAYDLAIVSSFENAEALERYRNHPSHIGIKNLLTEIADLAVVDYEY